ncbi:uncharacterized protein A1O9_09035 [Exophiala aquamarina CBS 119918]|uniref:Retrovirus-related Pol polyprotein from transposon TNT 1-94-like beta-barrel domain-containing protein n=1 Tax=Exophiala aquamarina CBS 119918 TaxID=1182545 RepID=A0A072P5N2_9EURO|nr:uncharacterized protein A1O9_09035 [Exophiala aquamarina CBS 119918]KEF54593.1 hypothetical protein A1O9_09035 [Exophiala aquamarina CBS 119918]
MEPQPNPRGDLSLATIQPISYYSKSDPSLAGFKHHRITSYAVPFKKSKKLQCHDWIFSTASNTHVAIDRASFKTYVSFTSYVLTVSDQRQVAVRGIGSVEIKIRRAAGSKEIHTIHLDNVLHVPDWMCNIFSDIFFTPDKDYEHTWTRFGVNFSKKEKAYSRPWGYTENFCGLDRLVLSKLPHGRSPMLEDPDREIFSISLNFPQSQNDKWNNALAAEVKKEATRYEKSLSKKQNSPIKESEKDNTPSEDETIKKISLEGKLKRVRSSTLTDGVKWRLMPDISILSAHMRNQSANSLNELEGDFDFLKRVSSVNFRPQSVR